MKNLKFLICFFLLIGFENSFSQGEIQIKASCFADGDVSTVGDMLKYPSITLITISSSKDVKLISYNCDFSGTSTKNNDFGFNNESISLINKLKSGQIFSIKDVLVEVTNKKTRKKETIELSPIKIKIGM